MPEKTFRCHLKIRLHSGLPQVPGMTDWVEADS
jgi:hypothetical protein